MMPALVLAKASHRTGARSGPGHSSSAPPPAGALAVRVLVVDDQGLMREALCALLGGMGEIEIVGSAAIGPEAVRSAANLRPDVVVLDFPPLAGQGPKLISGLKQALPDVRVVVLTFHKETRLIDAALRAGADGYVLKSDRREELFSAVMTVVSGQSFISSSLEGRIVRDRSDAPRRPLDGRRPATAAALTERERQVIRLIAAGHRTREIAQMLSLSFKTIEKHRANLMRKLGLRNATAVAAYAIANGFVEG